MNELYLQCNRFIHDIYWKGAIRMVYGWMMTKGNDQQ